MTAIDPLTRLALVGVARDQAPPEGNGPLVDAIVTRLGDLPLDRRVLLAAGARAAATMAGHRQVESTAASPVAAPETRRPCSPKAARIVGEMLRGQHEELLPEALALLARAGQRLPHALLPDALRIRGEVLRGAARKVLGERGAWLARMNEAWSWALASPATASLDALERDFTEGTPAVRRAAFAQARALDPTLARGWLEATWGSEKADERGAFVALLREGLGGEDEAFLEAQLDDRAAGAREAAQALLPRLVESAFVRRMIARADAMLDVERSALLGRPGALDLRPLEKIDPAGERDGLVAKPAQGGGARELWLIRTVAAIPPAHWTTRFGAPAESLVAAAEKTDWAAALGEGWTRAALLHRDGDWLSALWDFWQRVDEKVVNAKSSSAMLVQILPQLPAAEAASRVTSLFTDDRTRIELTTALRALPGPWPDSLGAHWVARLREECRAATARFPALLASTRPAALALPPASLAVAQEPLEAPSDHSYAHHALADYSEILRLRLDLVQEIVP